ncbi:MAG: DUF374 domain-containing protein [Proteobacteria bacterium]|nr:DUF374 domain-containing protein [Pseudomonadota bacterium]
MLRFILTSRLFIAITGIIAAIYVMLLLRSIRWQRLRGAGLTGEVKVGRAAIIINWHSRILAFPAVFPRKYNRHYIMSPSRDGRTAAWLAYFTGVKRITGSSTSGGANAMLAMRRRLAQGDIVAINPDGPRGPARQASASLLRLALASGADLIPFAWSASPCHRFRSWDRTMLPGWFGRGVYAFGDAIPLPKGEGGSDIETHRLAIEDALNFVTAQVDAHFGYPPDHLPNRYGTDKKVQKDKHRKKPSRHDSPPAKPSKHAPRHKP